MQVALQPRRERSSMLAEIRPALAEKSAQTPES